MYKWFDTAHARLMFRNEVMRLDAITAILCIESSMTISAIVDSMGNALHSNFSEEPDQECILFLQTLPKLLFLDFLFSYSHRLEHWPLESLTYSNQQTRSKRRLSLKSLEETTSIRVCNNSSAIFILYM